MTRKFTAAIQDFADLTEKQMIAVVVDSVQDVLEAAQTPQVGITKGATSFEIGKIPVAEAFLQESLEIGYNGAYQATNGAVVLSAAKVSLGDTINARWTQAYALRIELGFSGTDSLGRTYNQAGRHFVGANAKRWPEFVAANAAKRRV